MIVEWLSIAQNELNVSGLMPSLLSGGFSGALVVLLLVFGQKEQAKTRKEMQAIREAINHNTLSNTTLVLSMTFVPRQFHEEAKRIETSIKETEAHMREQ